MTMTKKETAHVEALLTEAALRRTARVDPDVPPPSPGCGGSELTTGWTYIGERSDHPYVDVACSSSVFHGIGYTSKTTSQRPISLFSTKILALKALRHRVENDCCDRLRRIDRSIEEEEPQ